MAQLLGVSAPTVEGAIRALVALGFVRVSRGVGVYVAVPRDQTALLNYVWRNASAHELAVMRCGIDERAAPLAASAVAHHPMRLLPEPVKDISFFAMERSANRVGGPWTFIEKDLAFHTAVVQSLPDFEIGTSLYERISTKLTASLVAVAEIQAHDEGLDERHLALAAAIIHADVPAAARLARRIAQAELETMTQRGDQTGSGQPRLG